MPFLVFLVCLNGIWAADHPTSFIDLDYAIWANHAFSVGKVGEFTPNSIDLFQYKGAYYSASAPGTAILAYPFVALGFYLEGGFTLFGKVLLLSEVFVALVNALAVYVLYRIAKNFFCSERAAIFVAFAYAFSTISWPFATFLFQSDVSALFVLLALYFALNAVRKAEGRNQPLIRNFLLCGLAIGAALTVDYVDGILVPVFLGYLIVASSGSISNRIKGAVSFLLTSLIGVLLLALYNYSSFGTFYTSSEQLYQHSPGLFSSFSFFLPRGLFLNLFTPLRGLFFYSPIMAAGLFGIYKQFKSSSFNRNSLFILLVFLAIVIPYSMFYGPAAGNSFGPRYLIPAMPLLLLPIGSVIDDSHGKWTGAVLWLLYLLYSVGVSINGLAALEGAIPPTMQWFSSPLISDVLPALARGQLDTWWVHQVGPLWPCIVLLILSLAIVAPALVWRLQESGERARSIM
ncbi:MAG: glycosyltransferase family 39 protein [Nitrososphaerales archaeon]